MPFDRIFLQPRQVYKYQLEDVNLEKLFSYGTLQMENVQKETFGRTLKGTKDILVGYILSEVKIKIDL